MPQYDVLIRGGTVVTPDAVLAADVAIADERLVALEPELAGSAASEIDATGLLVLPGVIDAHVHCNEPGRTHYEGLASGTRALAAGGATLFFDMPLNAHPPVLDGPSFDQKVAAAQQAVVVDYALWGGLVPGNVDRLDELAARGVVGFKAFLSATGVDDFQAADDLTLYQGMAHAARLGRIVAVHAENDALTSRLAQQARAAGRTGVRDYLASRPVVAELEAIARAILLASETGCALHIVHVSSGRGVALVLEAQARGVDVSCETCAHYLFFTEEDVERIGALAKCAPPIRDAAEQAALWEHLAAGRLPMVTSDHSPAPPELKQAADFFAVWGGISGCQSTLAALLTAGYDQRTLPLPLLLRTVSANVAARFGLAPQRGQVAVGALADVALVDAAATATLRPADLFYRHAHSPYVGHTLRGRVVRTLVRGQTVFRDGQVVAPPGSGRLVRWSAAA